LENIVLEGASVGGRDYVGAVVGYINGGSVANSSSAGTVGGRDAVGGVAGRVVSGSVTNSRSAASVSGRDHVGGVAGFAADSARVEGSHSTGTVSGTGKSIGGVTGTVVNNSMVAGSHSTGAVSGTHGIGGVVGTVNANSNVTGSYSTGTVVGTDFVGGLVGMARRSHVKNNVALNKSVQANGSSFGRVVGSNTHSSMTDNAAFSGMTNKAGTALWVDSGADRLNGADITAPRINVDGTLGGRFTSEDGWGWVVRDESLPGFGQPVDMPAHLQADDAAIEAERASRTGQTAAVPTPSDERSDTDSREAEETAGE
jgi:hypothetical protein